VNSYNFPSALYVLRSASSSTVMGYPENIHLTHEVIEIFVAVLTAYNFIWPLVKVLAVCQQQGDVFLLKKRLLTSPPSLLRTFV
jgi:hypothetical protein